VDEQALLDRSRLNAGCVLSIDTLMNHPYGSFHRFGHPRD